MQSFNEVLVSVCKAVSLDSLKTITLLNSHHAEITATQKELQESMRQMEKQHQEEMTKMRLIAGRATYKAAQFAVRSLLDYAASSVILAHETKGGRIGKCVGVKTNSTTEALQHLLDCDMLPIRLRDAIMSMQDISLTEFDTGIPPVLFSRLSNNIHLAPFIEADCVLIPSDLSKLERHLIITIALSMRADWKYVNEDGKDVSEMEEGLRQRVNAIRTNHSKDTHQ